MLLHVVLALERLVADLALERRLQVHESMRVQPIALVELLLADVALVGRDAVMLIHVLLQDLLVDVRLAANLARIALLLLAAAEDVRVVLGHRGQQDAAALAHFRLRKVDILAMALQRTFRLEATAAQLADERELGRVLVGDVLRDFTLLAGAVVAVAAFQRLVVHDLHVLGQLAFVLGDVRAQGAVERLARVNGTHVLLEFAKLAESSLAEFAGVWSVSGVNI